MKRLLLIILMLVLTISFTACKGETNKVNVTEELVYEQIVKIYENSALTNDEVFDSFDFQRLEYTNYITNLTLPYRLFLPEDYNKSKKYPVLLFLHGAGARGNDNESHIPSFTQGFDVASDILGKAIIVCPQCPSNGWWNIDENSYGDENGELGTVMKLLRSVIEKYNGDRNRIYVTGISMGAFGTWDLLGRYGNFFAAAVPVCGGGDTSHAQKLSTIPIWIYHGTADQTVSFSSSQRMYDAINSFNNGLIKLKRLEGVDHDAWKYAYVDREMFTWMFEQNRQTNQSLDYNAESCFKVVSPSGKTIISDEDISMVYHSLSDEKKEIKLILNASASESMINEYSKNVGGIFTVYYFSEKLYDFKIVNVPESKAFKLLSITDDETEFQKLFKTLTKLAS